VNRESPLHQERTNRARADDASFLAGGGETGALMRSIDWQTTLLGPAREWPQSLRTCINLCLTSRFPIALYWGPEFVMLYNDDLLPMVGANKHPRAMGRPAFEVLPEIRGIIEPMLRHVVTTGEAVWSGDLMLPLLRHDTPEESYFTFTYSPIRDEAGGVGGVFCAVLETTDKVIEERRLRLLNALADVTQAKTPAEACALAAAQIERDPSDVPFSLLYLLDERSGVATLAGAANIEPGTPRAPASIASGDHSTWPFAVSGESGSPGFVTLEDGPGGARGAVILPIERAGGGRPLGFVVAGLGPYLRQSESYERFHNLLAASISQGVSNAAAYEAERQRAESLAELDRAKTTFFSNVSHEFRTPLTLMLAPIQDMATAAPGSSIDPVAVDLLQRNAIRLLKLVNTLLEFSRIEAGRVEAVYEPVDLPAMTAELASSFRAAIERAGLALVVDCPPLPEAVYVDRDMWEKIVLNLLSNAFKFTFAGSITVRLRMVSEGATLDVADTGVGIADDARPRLFERFHRIEGARSRSHEGSGIGLALIQELVRLHGGDVRVSSRIDEGTTFSVRIPRGVAHLPQERIRAARTLPSTAFGAEAFVKEALRWGRPSEEDTEGASQTSPPRTVTSRKERIVFADDNADMRDYVASLLGQHWAVETVSDGRAALASIRRNPASLVLCDVMMPGLDGFGLLRELRADATTRTLPVILLSARAGQEATAEGLHAGANDYVIKPFSARELIARVSAQLAIAAIRREADAAAEAQRRVIDTLFNDAPAAIALLQGPDLVVKYANARAIELWQRSSPGDVLGKRILDALPNLREQGFDDLLRKVMQTGEAFIGNEVPVTFTRPGRDSSSVFINFVHAPTRNAEGAIDGVATFGFDVTALVIARARSELGAQVGRAFVSNDSLSDQLRFCCEALVTMDAAFARIWTYNATHETLELRASAGVYTHINGPHARVPLGSFKIGQIASERKPHLTNNLIDDPRVSDPEWAKREGFVSFAGYPLVVGGRLMGVMALFGRRELSAETIDALSSVADQIAIGIDRDASERFRELFIGMLGHDLRNPLNAVLMATHLLSSTVPESQRRTLGRIHNSATRMDRMITQVLDFTRARSGGGIPITRGLADLGTICAHVVDELTVTNPERSIEAKYSGDLRSMWDGDRLAQVFSNLLGNALAYGKRDGPVRVTLTAVDAEVRCVVHNQGSPVPAELLPNLFDPFRRAAHAKIAGTQGLGLGLFISDQIVRAHGGSISVTSNETEGTMFEVILPKVSA
jgi:signal transduction histidine kinase/CheY-like chemotaxis protein